MRIPILQLVLLFIGLAGLVFTSAGCSGSRSPEVPAEPVVGADIDYARQQLAKYARHDMACNLDLLDENQRAVLDELVAAAKVIDGIFFTQVYQGNTAVREQLNKGGGPDNEMLTNFFRINYGPFDRLEEDAPFIGDTPKPKGANFYPEDMTKEEFETWVAAHPDEREAFEGTFTVIRRAGDGLKAIPYSEFYRPELERAAAHLRRAAELTDNESLRTFLDSRADAFLDNDYYQSDMDWMDIEDNLIDVTIGPYEVYEDNLFNYKAAFEAFICLRDPVESARLESIKGHLPAMERNLPIPDEYKNFNRGSESPISVVDVAISAGDTRAGVQTLAFNLPNDERVREAKGSKKVMLKNVLQAKYEKIYIPIAEVVLEEGLAAQTDFEAFFNHTLLHEVSHGLGPGNLVLDGEKTTVAKELKELYSGMEEAKADTLGVYNIQYLVDQDELAPERAEKAYVTFLGGIFRSIRFGVGAAHGKANIMILNYLLEHGGYLHDEATGRFSVNQATVADGFQKLATVLLTLQAEGDYEGAAAFIEKYGNVPPTVEQALSRLDGVPVDIDPHYELD
jgi:hypothetical protein